MACMDAIAAVKEQLPFWVRAGALWFYPPLFALLWFVSWRGMLRIGQLRPSADLHWTSRAELRAGRLYVLYVTSVSSMVVSWMFAAEFVSPLSLASPLALRGVTLGVLAFLGLGCLYLELRRSFGSWLTLAYFLRGQAMFWLVFLPALPITILMAAFTPASGWGMVLGLVLGAGGMVWLCLADPIERARRVGIWRPAPPGLVQMASEVSAAAGVSVRGVHVLSVPSANAYAFRTGDLAFTDRALQLLGENQVRAILHHEVGHLTEKSAQRTRRLYEGLVCLVVLGAWRPIVHLGGWLLFAGLLMVAFLLSMRAVKRARRSEEHADDHAIEHGDDAAGYARALEALHRFNLVPVVQNRRHATHPDLYDRLLKAGVQPDYPRPVVKRVQKLRGLLMLAVLVLVLAVPVTLLSQVHGTLAQRAFRSRSTADALAALTFGSNPWVVALLGDAAANEDPDLALTYYRGAEALNPDWIPFVLAQVRCLARRGQAGAAEARLHDARERFREGGGAEEWLAEMFTEVEEELRAAGIREPS